MAATFKATWNGTVIAESSDTVIVDDNHYFLLDAVKDKSFLVKSDHTSTCPYKGEANYYDLVVDGKTNPAACWYYPNPKNGVKQIKDRISFWKGVEINKSSSFSSNKSKMESYT